MVSTLMHFTAGGHVIVDKILYKNFKKETTVEFERFLVLCKKEKLKVWNEATKINNMKI